MAALPTYFGRSSELFEGRIGVGKRPTPVTSNCSCERGANSTLFDNEPTEPINCAYRKAPLCDASGIGRAQLASPERTRLPGQTWTLTLLTVYAGKRIIEEFLGQVPGLRVIGPACKLLEQVVVLGRESLVFRF